MGLLDTSELTMAVSTERQRADANREDVVDRLRNDTSLDVPIELTDLELWSNYMNEEMYELDKKVREFLKRTRYQRAAKNGYRTTVQVVFAWIFGRQPDPGDGYICRSLHTLLKYYCTSYTGATTYKGKPVTRVYRFSRFSGNTKRPYSLKLRMEESDGKGNVFRSGPDSSVDKRTYGRRANRPDGQRENG